MQDPVVKTMFHWTTDYAVGVRQIDEEHQRLFVLAERMHQAMLEGKGNAILEELLVRLVDYTFYHFAHEERLMERIRYPGFRPHQREHEDLRSRVRAMQDRAASGEVTMTIETMHFLMGWIKRHMIASDCRICDHMTANGLSLVE